MRKNKDDYAFISLEINKQELSNVMKAMSKEGLKSRSQLIRHLLYCLVKEVTKDGEQ
jgi:metal-responsive CopG/Arc/MetJ family transcriptional regulator